ncbi:hypothetical protein HQ545_01485 [Candidatus Woesearchaeota archaeon]|nr:hypothetical protein [Candidatus Woesearchaeota archaeon]
MECDQKATTKGTSDLEGLVYSVAYDLSRHEDGPRQKIGVMYHANLKDEPRVIAIRPYTIEAVEWVPDQGLYYTSKNDVWQLWDSQGTEIDRHIKKGKEVICVLAWVPGFGLCNAGKEGKIRRSVDEKGRPSGGVIAERPGRVYSLLWVPNHGLFDAGCTPKYHQIRKCLDKNTNKTDELIAERLAWKRMNGESSYSLPTLCWAQGIGLLDNGNRTSMENIPLVRYLDEHGNRCAEFLAIKEGDIAYVDAYKYAHTCSLWRHKFGIDHLIKTRSVMAWAQVPGQGLLYAADYDIHRFIDENEQVVEEENPVLRTYPHEVSAMTWIGDTK